MYVNCGSCPACLQEKAIKRSDRIRWQSKSDLVPWFVVLSYDNKYVPYIRQSEFDDFVNKKSEYLPVRRDFDCKWRQVKNKEGVREYRKKDIPLIKPIKLLEKRDFDYYGYKFDFDRYKNYRLPLIRKWISKDNCIYIADKSSVAWYEDVQNFIKRLKSYFREKYKKEGKFFDPTSENFKYFVCTEYGEEAHRSHIHFVPWTPDISQEEMLDAISQAWLFCSRDRLGERFGRAYDPSSYVASYVNSRSSAVIFYRYAKPFMCKHKISEDFGFAENSFSASSLWQMYCRRDCHINVQRVRERKLTTDNIIIPKYVISHFFPKYRGFYRLTSAEIFFIAQDPTVLRQHHFARKLGLFKQVKKFNSFKDFHFKLIKEGVYTPSNRVYSGLCRLKRVSKQFGLFTIVHRLNDLNVKPLSRGLDIDRDKVESLIRTIQKKQNLFCKETGLTPYHYATCYSQIWTIRASNILIDAHKDVNYHSADYLTLFDNILDYFEEKVYHEVVDFLVGNMTYEEISVLPRSPNDFPENIVKTDNLTYWYDVYAKDKFVYDSIYNKVLKVG